MKKFLIITVIVLAVAFVSYSLWKKYGKKVEDTTVPDTVNISQEPVTRPPSMDDIVNEDIQVIEDQAKKINSPEG